VFWNIATFEKLKAAKILIRQKNSEQINYYTCKSCNDADVAQKMVLKIKIISEIKNLVNHVGLFIS